MNKKSNRRSGQNLRARGKYHKTSGSRTMRPRNDGMSVMIGLPESSRSFSPFTKKNEDKNMELRFGPQVWVIIEALDFFERLAPIEWTHCSTPPTSGQ